MQILILSIILLFPIIATSQTTLPKPESKALFPIWGGENVHFNGGIKNLKWGFIDVHGNVVIKPQFDSVRNFSEGLASVKIGDYWGYINESGEIVIPPRWRESTIDSGYLPTVDDFRDGLAIVIERVTWAVINDSNYYFYTCGYINTKGEYVIQPKSREQCGYFSEGFARTQVDISSEEYKDKIKSGEWSGSYGFIDKKGDWAIKPKFSTAGDFINGFAPVDWFTEQGGIKPVFIDTKGNKVRSVKVDKSRIKTEQGEFKPALVAERLFRAEFDVAKLPSIFTGYRNQKGKYVWLAPEAEKHLGKDWIKENYIGTQKFE